jgi:hypothetical protein
MGIGTATQGSRTSNVSRLPPLGYLHTCMLVFSESWTQFPDPLQLAQKNTKLLTARGRMQILPMHGHADCSRAARSAGLMII